MMDYAMEQEMEMEALTSILMDDLQAVSPDKIPSDWSCEGGAWRVEVSPQDEEAAEALAIAPKAELVFAHPAKYPEELPLLRIDALQGMDDAELAAVRAKADEAAEEYLGMASIYSVLQAMQEALDAVVAEQAARGGAGGGSAAREETDEQRQARERAAEEARIAELRRHGTPVTPEAFHAWADKFEAERQAAKEAERLARGVADDGQRLTGKQWFLQQEALHRGVEEPELGEGEEDGEGDDRDTWECRRERGEEDEDEIDFDDDDDDDDDDDLLDQLAAEKGL